MHYDKQFYQHIVHVNLIVQHLKFDEIILGENLYLTLIFGIYTIELSQVSMRTNDAAEVYHRRISSVF
jgi:hypothetical protein